MQVTIEMVVVAMTDTHVVVEVVVAMGEDVGAVAMVGVVTATVAADETTIEGQMCWSSSDRQWGLYSTRRQLLKLHCVV